MEKMTYRELTTLMAQLSAHMNEIDTYLTGIVSILGREEILNAAKEYVEDQAHKLEETLRTQVEAGVKDGWLKPTTVSGLKSLVVGYESMAGQPTRRMQVIPDGMLPTERGNYLGRSVGEEFTVQTPNGVVSTKITEVYEIDEERRREVIAEHQLKAKAAEPPAAAPGAEPADKVDDIV